MAPLSPGSTPAPEAVTAPRQSVWKPFFWSLGSVIVSLLGVALIWHIMSLVFPRTLFPGIVETFSALPAMAERPTFWADVWKTTWRTWVGFGFAFAAGIVAGMLMGFFLAGQTLVRPLILVIQTISAVIWCFFAVIWFGLSDLSVVFVIFIAGFPIMAFSMWEGVKAIDLDLEAMARAFRVPAHRVFLDITVPSLYPYMFAGIRSSFSYCWRTAILAELVIGQRGLGYSMYFAWQNFRTVEVFAWVVVTVGLMLLMEYALIRPLETYLMRWRPNRDRLS